MYHKKLQLMGGGGRGTFENGIALITLTDNKVLRTGMMIIDDILYLPLIVYIKMYDINTPFKVPSLLIYFPNIGILKYYKYYKALMVHDRITDVTISEN